MAHHFAAPPLHHEEVHAEDGGIVAENVGSRRPVELSPEPGENLVLASHVVRAGGELTQGRPTQHELVRAEAKEIGQVRRAVRELLDLEGVGAGAQDISEPRPQPRLKDVTIQLLSAAHGSDLRPIGGRGVGHAKTKARRGLSTSRVWMVLSSAPFARRRGITLTRRWW